MALRAVNPIAAMIDGIVGVGFDAVGADASFTYRAARSVGLVGRCGGRCRCPGRHRDFVGRLARWRARCPRAVGESVIRRVTGPHAKRDGPSLMLPRFATARAVCSSFSSAIFCASMTSPIEGSPRGRSTTRQSVRRLRRARRYSSGGHGGCDNICRYGSPLLRNARYFRIGRAALGIATASAKQTLFLRAHRNGRASRRVRAPELNPASGCRQIAAL